jgi:prepilin-type N-terminal cleavage/methylation domain-containing protein
MKRLRRLVRAQGGYSLVELMIVMVILTIVLVGLTGGFVEGTKTELSLDRRFQAQMNAGLALSKLRQDVHCSSAITPSGASASITLTQPSYCLGGGGFVSWCTVGSGTSYTLYRQAGSTCGATGKQYAQYLTTGTVFTYTGQSTSSLAKLHIDFPVNVNPSTSVTGYELTDDIVLKNSTRT